MSINDNVKIKRINDQGLWQKKSKIDELPGF